MVRFCRILMISDLFILFFVKVMLIKMLEDDNLENIKRKVIILYLVLSSLCIFSLILKVIIYLCNEIVNRSV